jgi:uncharacterized membrane protein (DUF485 family)
VSRRLEKEDESMDAGKSPGQPPPHREAIQPPAVVGEEIHWEGLEETPEFRELVRRRMRFVLPATIFFLVYYFLLPLGNGLAPDFMKTKVFGQVNIAYLFALSEFAMAWVLAWLYIRKANTVFDGLAAKVRARAGRGV